MKLRDIFNKPIISAELVVLSDGSIIGNLIFPKFSGFGKNKKKTGERFKRVSYSKIDTHGWVPETMMNTHYFVVPKDEQENVEYKHHFTGELKHVSLTYIK